MADRIGVIWCYNITQHLKQETSVLPTSVSSIPCACSKWVESVDRRCNARQERLEQELSGSKTNLMKENIRMGHNDLGSLLYERGDLQVWTPDLISYKR